MSGWGDEFEDDGITQAQRCLQAMAETEDLATRISLWRLASTYAQRDRVAGGVGAPTAGLARGLESPDARLRHL